MVQNDLFYWQNLWAQKIIPACPSVYENKHRGRVYIHNDVQVSESCQDWAVGINSENIAGSITWPQSVCVTQQCTHVPEPECVFLQLVINVIHQQSWLSSNHQWSNLVDFGPISCIVGNCVQLLWWPGWVISYTGLNYVLKWP